MPRASPNAVGSLSVMASASVTALKAVKTVAAIACATVLVAACTTTSTGPTPTTSIGGPAVEQASLVVVDSGLTSVKAKALPAVCNGVTAPERAVTTTQPLTVPVATTAVIPSGHRFTMCAPEAYQPAAPAPNGRTAVKVRMYYTNPGPAPKFLSALTRPLFYVGGDLVKPSVIEGEFGVKSLSSAQVLPGETATWQVAYAVPSEKVVYMPFVYEGYQTSIEFPMPAAGTPPQVQPQLPAATPLTTPATLPALEPGMTLSPGHTGVIEGDIPHTCGGKATGISHPIEEKQDDLKVIPPGDSGQFKDSYRVTLCPGVPYQPSPAVFPKGDYDYRLFTAYLTLAKGKIPVQPAGLFFLVSDAQGKVIAQPVGRVLDPTVVAYADRTTYMTGKTMMWTFAVAYPKAGGPYFLRTTAFIPAMWRLS